MSTTSTRGSLRDLVSHPALALGSTVLWGMIELVALCRSRWSARGGKR